MTEFSESIAIKAPIERVFEVISDFARYPEFVKENESAEIKSKTKNRVKVAFLANLVVKIHYTLDFKLSPPDKITWEMTEGDFMKKNSGSWQLNKLEKNLTDATFTIDVEFPFWVPASMAQELIKSNLPKMLKEFKTEAEKK